MSKDCSEFIASCLHCLTGKTGHKIPRTLSTTIHRKKQNDAIHFEYLYIVQGIGNMNYNLVVSDNLSSYLRIIPARKKDAETAAGENFAGELQNGYFFSPS